MTYTPVKFQRNRHTIVGGVAHTKYLDSLHFGLKLNKFILGGDAKTRYLLLEVGMKDRRMEGLTEGRSAEYYEHKILHVISRKSNPAQYPRRYI